MGARTTATVLARARHVVECVLCSVDALAMAASWDPDVILLDRRLQGTDGLDLVARLRRPDGTRRIVMMSGDPLPPEVRPLVDGFVLKPAGVRALLDAVAEDGAPDIAGAPPS